MTVVNPHEAKTRLSELLRRAEAGEESVIARGGKPIAKLTPVAEPAPKPRGKRKLGTMKGAVIFNPGWDAPLTAEELALCTASPLARSRSYGCSTGKATIAPREAASRYQRLVMAYLR